MKIALIGYGKMGKTIEKLATEAGHSVVMRATSEAPVRPSHLEGADVAIEFTVPNAAVTNILACLDAGIPVVCGTTGWYNRLEEVQHAVKDKKGALLYATNFSLGVNVFNRIVSHAAELMNALDTYTPSIKEIHHVHKKDAPSGTALTLGDLVLDAFPDLKDWSDKPEQKDTLFIESIREGEVFGTHSVRFQSAIDTIELKHEAHNRNGFASGALRSAEWLVGKTGSYTMKDLLNAVLK